MTKANTCPMCDGLLPTDAPSGICPRCLLRAAMERPEELPAAGNAVIPKEPAPRAKVAPPEPSALAAYFPELEILEPLGHGGMGAVYKARQKKLDRLVALKIIKPELASDPSFAERFHREARVLAQLNHANIVTVHDFGEVGELHFLTMEYVEGVTLRHLLETKQLTSEQALAIIPQLCEGLQFAHDEAIVHRDIKPENILIDGKGRVKIADFGLAKLVTGLPDPSPITRTDQVMGTPSYMAPEQREGSREVDHRADIYSLGVVFYEMLTGDVPLGHFEPPSHKALVDSRLDSIVLRSLAADPDRRFQQAAELKSSVEELSSRARLWHDTGISTIVERELQDAWKWIIGDLRKPVQHHLRLPVLLMVALSFAGGAMVFLPWMHLEIDKLSSISDVAVKLENPVSETVTGYELWSGIVSAGAFVGLALLVIAGPITRPLAVWQAIAMTVLAATVLLSTLLFQKELESRTYPVSFVALRHDSGELEDKSVEIRYYPAFLHGLDHRLAYRTGFWGALGLSAVLLLLGATGIRHAVWHPHVETGPKGCQATDPPLTSLRFCVTADQDIGPQVAFHFSGLGYRLVDEQPNVWVFQRGRRFAGFWTSPFCTDIRAYYTTLTVNAMPGKKGELLVSCVWAVRTWGAWFGRREIRQLEAEGGELKSLLGGGDDRILSDSESITPPWYSVAAIIVTVLSVVILSVAVIGYVVISQDQNWLSISNKSLGDPIADEASKLQGRWKVVEAEDSEKKAPAEVLKLMSFVFEGDRLTFEYGELAASFKIDPTKKVKEIDLTVLAGSEKGEVLHGIYTLDGDHLKLCFSLDSNKTRPCEFRAGKDNRALLYVLQRDGQ